MLKFNVTLLYVFVAFPIVYAILKRYLIVPLAGILDDRDRDERTAAKVHSESLQELQKTIASVERDLARARQEALKEREALRAQGRAAWDQRLAQALAASRSSIDRASADLEAEAARASADLPLRARSLARELAEKILGRKLAA